MHTLGRLNLQADLIERIDEIEEAAPTSPVEDGLSELLGQAGPAETPDEWKVRLGYFAQDEWFL